MRIIGTSLDVINISGTMSTKRTELASFLEKRSIIGTSLGLPSLFQLP